MSESLSFVNCGISPSFVELTSCEVLSDVYAIIGFYFIWTHKYLPMP